METGEKVKQVETRGRKAIIDAEIISTIANNIKLGYPQTRACQMAGVSKSVFYKWLSIAREAIQKAEEDGTTTEGNLYVELMDSVATAQALFIAEGIDSIKREGPSGYKWLLARLFRKEFGESLDIGGDLGDVKLQLVLPGMAKTPPNHTPLEITAEQEELEIKDEDYQPFDDYEPVARDADTTNHG